MPTAFSTVAAPEPEDVIDWTQARTSVVCTSATATADQRGSTYTGQVYLRVDAVVFLRWLCVPTHFAYSSPTLTRPAFGAT
ncbi:hypothetical protein A5776_00715 [Mycolicibacterium elephantis]|nr:hypothetical protein A5776_00715 [Mycolicibacterium elephantis]